MTALAMLQRDFREAMLGESDDPGIAVYRHTYRAQLLACLADTFPVLRAWLGEEAFSTLSIAYALAHPPQSWSLDHFPARFAPWLAAREDVLTADLARIEWALAECFVAHDQPVLTIADIPEIDWDKAQLALIAGARLLHLATNAAAIWAAAQSDAPLPTPVAQPCAVLIWRREEQCHLRELPLEEALALSVGDLAFGDLCGALCEQLGDEQGVAQAGALLVQWARDGVMRAPQG